MTRRVAIGRRLKPATRLRSSIQASGGTVVRQLAQRPAVPSDASVCYEIVLEHLRAELLAVEQKLTAADRAYTADRARLIELERQRDQARSKLHREHRRIKRFLSGFFQPHYLAGIVGPTPNSALELTRHVTPAIEFLRQLDTAEPPFLETACDVPAMAGQLEEDVCEFETVATCLESARVAVAVSRSYVDTAITEADHVTLCITRVLESLCHLAEEHGLAD